MLYWLQSSAYLSLIYTPPASKLYLFVYTSNYSS